VGDQSTEREGYSLYGGPHLKKDKDRVLRLRRSPIKLKSYLANLPQNLTCLQKPVVPWLLAPTQPHCITRMRRTIIMVRPVRELVVAARRKEDRIGTGPLATIECGDYYHPETGRRRSRSRSPYCSRLDYGEHRPKERIVPGRRGDV